MHPPAGELRILVPGADQRVVVARLGAGDGSHQRIQGGDITEFAREDSGRPCSAFASSYKSRLGKRSHRLKCRGEHLLPLRGGLKC